MSAEALTALKQFYHKFAGEDTVEPDWTKPFGEWASIYNANKTQLDDVLNNPNWPR